MEEQIENEKGLVVELISLDANKELMLIETEDLDSSNYSSRKHWLDVSDLPILSLPITHMRKLWITKLTISTIQASSLKFLQSIKEFGSLEELEVKISTVFPPKTGIKFILIHSFFDFLDSIVRLKMIDLDIPYLVSPNVFLHKMREMDFTNNKIKFFPANFFTQLPILKDIILENNPIITGEGDYEFKEF